MKKTISLLVLSVSLVATLGGQSKFYLESSPTSWIGHGQTLILTTENGYDFTSRKPYENDNAIGFWIQGPLGYFSLEFDAPKSMPHPLQVGEYPMATRFPFQGDTNPGLDFSSNGRGNNHLSGSFTIREIEYANGAVSKAAVDFVQYDEKNLDWWNIVQFRYNSDFPMAVGIKFPTLTIRKNEQVPDQNIAVGTPMQMFGSYLAVVTGGAMLSSSQIFYFGTDFGGGVTNTSNFVLVNKEGTVIAGPVDPEYLFEGPPLGKVGSITFTETIALPEGTNALFLKGRAKTPFSVNTQVVTGTAPSLWTVTDLSGTPLPQSPPATGLVIGQTMTVRGPTLTVSFTAGEQTVIAGSRQVSFGAYVLDATQSSEDIRVVNISGDYRFNEANSAMDLTNIRLYDGTTTITTGSNVRNPSQFGAQTFTLDGTGFIIPKGTVKMIQVRADVRTSVNGPYQWGVLENQASAFSAVGLASAQSAAVTIAEKSGTFILNVIPHGEVAITQEYTPAISEARGTEVGWEAGGGGGVFFILGITPWYEDVQAETLAFRVSVTMPANHAAWGNGLLHEARLANPADGVVLANGVLMHVVGGGSEEDGMITSVYSLTFWVKHLVFPQDITTRLGLFLEYDYVLQTGDEVACSLTSSTSNQLFFTGVTSGARITPSTMTAPTTGGPTVAIRRIPENPVGDVNGDGKIDVADLSALQAVSAAALQGQNIVPLRQWDTFPDGRIDEWDIAALGTYLKGLFLTLPVGDVNYDWKLSTTDISLARRGILGIQLLRRFQTSQGDVNMSGGVTTLDISLIRRLILGLGIPR